LNSLRASKPEPQSCAYARCARKTRSPFAEENATLNLRSMSLVKPVTSVTSLIINSLIGYKTSYTPVTPVTSLTFNNFPIRRRRGLSRLSVLATVDDESQTILSSDLSLKNIRRNPTIPGHGRARHSCARRPSFSIINQKPGTQNSADAPLSDGMRQNPGAQALECASPPRPATASARRRLALFPTLQTSA
jgi:hypothetical protein